MLPKGGLKGFKYVIDDIRVLKDSLKRFKHQILATFQPYFLDILVFFLSILSLLYQQSVLLYINQINCDKWIGIFYRYINYLLKKY